MALGWSAGSGEEAEEELFARHRIATAFCLDRVETVRQLRDLPIVNHGVRKFESSPIHSEYVHGGGIDKCWIQVENAP